MVPKKTEISTKVNKLFTLNYVKNTIKQLLQTRRSVTEKAYLQ